MLTAAAVIIAFAFGFFVHAILSAGRDQERVMDDERAKNN